MPEFLKHLIVLGMVSMITMSHGYDARPPDGAPTRTEDVVFIVKQGDILSAGPVMDAATSSAPDKPDTRAGVAVAQSNPDASALAGVPRPESTLEPAHLEVKMQNQADGGAVADSLAPPTPDTSCRPVQSQGYGSLNIRGGATNYPAAAQADLNLGQRAWKPVNAWLGLVSLGGPTDGNAPRFSSLFAPGRVPRLSGAYQVYNWDFRSGRRTTPVTSPAVTLAGFATAPGEFILVPSSGYNIGDGYAALVLFAEESRVTLKYTREDNVAVGYTLHLENICVDPRLVAFYRFLNGAGRRQLPALRSGQALGTALGIEILAGIQDSGAWMDPRSRKDWWQ